MNRVLTGALVLFAGVAVFALSSSQDREPWEVPDEARAVENPVAETPDVVQEGAALFKKNCVMCHGTAGKGDGPATARLKVSPPDLTTADARARMTDGEIFYKISVGKRPMRGMAKKLSEDERWALVHFVRSLQTAS